MCATSTVGTLPPQTTRETPLPPPPRPSWRLRQQRLFSVLLDSVAAIFVLVYLHRNPSYLNPWNIQSAKLWALGFACIRLGVLFYDHLVVFVIENIACGELLPTRRPGAPPVRFVGLDSRSIAYLSLNSLNEYAFVMRLTRYLWLGGHGGSLSWKLADLTPWNTAVALGIMFVSMDAMYAPLHHLMHLPALYPLVHKHHHRQHYPARGYLDAGNEHPIEHMIGVICTWFAVCASEVLLPTCGMWLGRIKTGGFGGLWEIGGADLIKGGGVHALTVMLFFQFHAALACMNHSPYDVRFSLPFIGSASLFGSENQVVQSVDGANCTGNWLRKMITGQWFQYSVEHHEMHHRKFNFNYGQYCMFYDLWMGTFIEYEGPLSAAQLEAKKRNSLKGE
jgi:sterol desaturase/sphingolipid hydroxylase (fatty acid hydroxylase superfamily)